MRMAGNVTNVVMQQKRLRGESDATTAEDLAVVEDDAVVPEKRMRMSADDHLFFPVSIDRERREVIGYLAGKQPRRHRVRVSLEVAIRLHSADDKINHSEFIRRYNCLHWYKAILLDSKPKRSLTANYVIRCRDVNPSALFGERLSFEQELADADVVFGRWYKLPTPAVAQVDTVFDLTRADPSEFFIPENPELVVGFMTIAVDPTTKYLSRIVMCTSGGTCAITGKTTEETIEKFKNRTSAFKRVDAWMVWANEKNASSREVVSYIRAKTDAVPLISAFDIATSQDHSLRNLLVLESAPRVPKDLVQHAQFLKKELIAAYVPAALALMEETGIDLEAVLRPLRSIRICHSVIDRELRVLGFRRLKSVDSRNPPTAIRGGKTLGATPNTLYSSSKEYVAVQIDVISSYPSAVIERNLCTSKGSHQSDQNVFLPKIMASLLRRRLEAKAIAATVLPDEKRKYTAIAAAVKTTSAAICGAFGSHTCRHYDPPLLNAITSQGQLVLNEIVNTITDKVADDRIIHGVTDSVTFCYQDLPAPHSVNSIIREVEEKFSHTKLQVSDWYKKIAMFSKTSYAGLTDTCVKTAGLLPNKRECPRAVAEACKEGLLRSWLTGESLDIGYDLSLKILHDAAKQSLVDFVCTKPPRLAVYRSEYERLDKMLHEMSPLHAIGTPFAYFMCKDGVMCEARLFMFTTPSVDIDIDAYALSFIAPFAHDIASRFGCEFTRVSNPDHTGGSRASGASRASRKCFPIKSAAFDNVALSSKVSFSMKDLMW